MIELPIGTKFKLDEVDLVVVEDAKRTCTGCYFVENCLDNFACSTAFRSDKTNVIFKQIKPKLHLDEQDFELLKQIIKNVEEKIAND